MSDRTPVPARLSRGSRRARCALAAVLAAALIAAAPPAAAVADQFSFTADRMETVLAEGRERTVLRGNAALTSDDTEIFADSIELFGADLAFALSRGGVRVVQVGEGIELTSETVFYNRRDGVVRVEGDALLIDHDNEMVIRGGFLEHWEERNETSIQIGVQILSDDLVARAQLVHYDRGAQTLTLSGLPVVTWKGDEYHASRIFIDLDQERIVLSGAVSGQITSSPEDGEGGDAASETEPDASDGAAPEAGGQGGASGAPPGAAARGAPQQADAAGAAAPGAAAEGQTHGAEADR